MTRRLPLVFAASLAGFALFLLAHFFGPAMASGLMATALLAVVFIAAVGSGRVLLRAFEAKEISESEKTLIGGTLGIGLLSQAVFLLGVLGLLKTWAAVLLLGGLWVVGFTELREIFRSFSANRNLLTDRPFAVLAVLLPLGLAYLACFAPPHHYDALVYHLALPAAYIREGRILPVEHLVYTHFPQNGEMLYTLALLLGSDTLAQLFTWLGAFLSVWWIFEMGKREAPVSAVMLACALVSTHAGILLLASTAYVECIAMLWITASALSFFRWLETSKEAPSRGWLALAGVFAGLGLGTKYYAGICPMIFGAFLLLRWAAWAGGESQEEGGVASRLGRRSDFFVYAFAAGLAGSPWLLKNLYTVGNPVFPFLYQWLPARGVGWAAGTAGRYFDMLTEYGHTGGTAREFLRFIFTAAVGSSRYGGGADVLGSLGWSLIFAAFPAAVWAALRNRYLRWILFYCLCHWAVWFGTRVVLRFLIVIVPLAALPTACGLHQLWLALGPRDFGPGIPPVHAPAERAGRALLLGAAAAAVAVNLGLFLYVHAIFDSLPVVIGLQSRREYLSRKLDYYTCARFAAERLGQNDRILVVGEQRGYYVEQPHTATSVMSPNRFVLAANESADAEGLARRMKAEGLLVLLYVPREARRLRDGYGAFAFTERGEANWAGLQSRLKTLFEDPGRCMLMKIE
ncbi:MAG: hypothetical protein HY922_14295 [Elusimicrobia bacterium]|nr:hypothetical protein [Elusimicrobiota bacterium]